MKKFNLPSIRNSLDFNRSKTLQSIRFNYRENFESYQKVKKEYNLSAKSFRIYQNNAKRKNIYVLLESRLD